MDIGDSSREMEPAPFHVPDLGGTTSVPGRLRNGVALAPHWRFCLRCTKNAHIRSGFPLASFFNSLRCFLGRTAEIQYQVNQYFAASAIRHNERK